MNSYSMSNTITGQWSGLSVPVWTVGDRVDNAYVLETRPDSSQWSFRVLYKTPVMRAAVARSLPEVDACCGISTVKCLQYRPGKHNADLTTGDNMKSAEDKHFWYK